MASLNEKELNELQPKRPVLTGEVVDEEEFVLDPEEELIAELKSSRDVLRKCLIMFYFFGDQVKQITKREKGYIAKQAETIENRLQEMDEVIERLEEE